METKVTTSPDGKLSEERKAIDLRYLKQSLDRQQAWRDATAAEYGWTKHPNDMDLEPEQMKIVREAFVQRKPQPDFCK